MAEGYEDIDRLVAQRREGLDKQLQQMNDLTDKDVQLQTERLARQKEDIDRDTVQQNRAIYQDYKKNSNPFGVQAENLAGQGLENSGYAETAQARMYNTYQNNITATLNNARQLKSDVDFAINEAIKTGDITKGQNAMQIFIQSMQLLSEEYDLKQNREKFLWDKEQANLQQSNWQKEYDYQLSKDKKEDKWRQKEWNYKVKQDKNEEKWRQKEWDYTTSKKSLASSSRRSSGGSRRSYSTRKSSSGTTSSSINIDDGNTKNNSSVPKKKDGSEYTPKEIIANIKNVQGPEVKNSIYDGISGKTFKSVDALLNYYGYAGVND